MMIDYRMSRRQLGKTSLAAVLVIGTGLAGCSDFGAQRQLVCQHQRTGNVYAELPVSADTEIVLSWIHSIELSRWADTYRTTEDGLLLVSTRFKTYGAGMPMDEGTLRNENGWIVIDDIDRPVEAIRWINSHRVDYRIGIDGDETLIDTMSLPDREPIELRPV